MGRLGHALGLDAWAAHTAGLFEECGKAVLFRHAPEHYPAMLRAAANDSELCQLEHTGFGVSHDALGAALCDSWGIGPAAVGCVRHHVHAQATRVLEGPTARRQVQTLSIIVHALMNDATTVDEAVAEVAPQAGLDTVAVLRSARKLEEQLDEAAEHGR